MWCRVLCPVLATVCSKWVPQFCQLPLHVPAREPFPDFSSSSSTSVPARAAVAVQPASVPATNASFDNSHHTNHFISRRISWAVGFVMRNSNQPTSTGYQPISCAELSGFQILHQPWTGTATITGFSSRLTYPLTTAVLLLKPNITVRTLPVHIALLQNHCKQETTNNTGQENLKQITTTCRTCAQAKRRKATSPGKSYHARIAIHVPIRERWSKHNTHFGMAWSTPNLKLNLMS